MFSNRDKRKAGSLDLGERLKRLADLEPNDSPVISCYLDVTEGASVCQRFMQGQVAEVRNALSIRQRVQFDQVLICIEQWLGQAPQQVRSAAIFARGGSKEPFFTAVPLVTVVPQDLSCPVSAQHVRR